jgi:sugar lactone lactonase YvrE
VKGFVEASGYVSIEAEHYTRRVSAGTVAWQRIPDYGRTLSAMSVFPVTAKSTIPPGSSRLEYQMYLFDAGHVEVEVVLSPTLNFSPGRGLRYAISFDDEPPQIIDALAHNEQSDWETSVKDSVRKVRSTHTLAHPGSHTLKFWMVDPGVVLEKLVVDFGGVRPSYLGLRRAFTDRVNHECARLEIIMWKQVVPFLVVMMAATPVWGASYYTVRLDDPKAVYLTPDEFPVHGDGLSDDSGALQAAINKVQETTGQGIVFVPEGRYRLSRTIYIWPGIRVIGYGATRPVLLLGENTPGYQDRDHEKLLLFFAGWRPGAGRDPRSPARAAGPPQDGLGGAGEQVPDAGAGTFYSALSNIDIEIKDGNPGAVGVRAHYAQHCFLAHMDIHIGPGLAAIHEGGNVAEDVHFYGGRYGVWTRTPSPGWQFTLVDATFEGQREAAIQEGAAGLTLIRPRFRSVPTAIAIDPGSPDDLWVKDARMEDMSDSAVAISLENSARTEINMENVSCSHVRTFAFFRESGRRIAGPAPTYDVKVFSHGLNYADVGAAPAVKDVFETIALSAMPPAVESDLPDLPPRETWVNIRSLGAKGDGSTDDTETFRKAIAEHRTIYLPTGRYVVSDTITLRPDTVLIGLHPSATQIDLLDSTPAFQGIGPPKPLIEAPQGGTNIVIGIGLYTNGINPRAVAAKWMSGRSSMMNDVRFLGGHGTTRLDGTRDNPYNNTHTADPDINRRWDEQYPSLWVTQGGGGTFFDIWTPSTFAQAGMVVSDTATPGRIYQMSSEHHVRHEVQLHNVSNWQIYALQTEEERGEGGFALPLEIDGSSNITLSNLHIYRVISSFQPFPWAIKVSDSKNIRFRNVHCYSNSKVSFDDAVYDQTHHVAIRQREFAWLNLSGNPPAAPVQPANPLVAAGARLEKLAGGFFNISGGAAAPSGDFYFVDAHWQRIYRWSAASRQLSTVRDNPLDPVNLAFDRTGNLMVISYAGNGTVYSFKPGSSDNAIAILKPEAVALRPGMTAVLPLGDWRINAGGLQQPYRQYLSPDGTTFIPAGQDFVSGATSWGIKSSALLRGFGLARAVPGRAFYVTDEAQATTWVGTVQLDGSIPELRIFVNQGGEAVTTDTQGNVYVAAGQVYIYNPAGKLMDTIEVPERPVQLVFGGADRQTLFIPARTSLYAVRARFKGW